MDSKSVEINFEQFRFMQGDLLNSNYPDFMSGRTLSNSFFGGNAANKEFCMNKLYSTIGQEYCVISIQEGLKVSH